MMMRMARRGGLPSGVSVLDIGIPVPLATPQGRKAHGLSAPVPVLPASDVPIVAVIDDGIGFLNECSRMRAAGATTARTRFDGIWLQAPESAVGDPAEGIALGRVLEPAQIDSYLADLTTLEEAAVYHALNTDPYPSGTRRATGLSTNHGTGVLDIAAGIPEIRATAQDPLLMAVQLPPRSIEDTSGARFEAHILMGLRWILARAALRHPGRPVVVNLSLGMLAGTKDGSHILESQIERELSLWEARTGRRARLVMAFGNGFRNRQVARGTVAAGAALTLGWRVQPGDCSANHLEAYGAGLDKLDMILTDPQGGVMTYPAEAIVDQGAATGGRVRKTDTAALYRIAAQRLDGPRPCAPRLAACIAATDPLTGSAALAGLWQVSFTNTGTDPLDLRLEIQRDDRVTGAVNGVRQSYFDASGIEGEDSLFRDWNALPESCLLTEGGSHSALAGCLAPQIHTVGGLMQSVLRPAPYTAAGHPEGPVTGPSVSGISDEGMIQCGVLAAGTLSGAVRMRNGTSAAAPQVTRAHSHCTSLRKAPSGDAAADRAGEIAELASGRDRLNWLVPQDARARLGK